MELIFATNNPNKISEIQKALQGNITIRGLQEAGIQIDIPEPHLTLEANAREKAHTIFALTGKNCFSEDTGLETEALEGAPGVHSARYAGEQASSDDNMNKLLHQLKGETHRQTRFRTVICLIVDGNEMLFEGLCPGQIILERQGEGGFGYDPIFIPDGSTRTFAEMSIEEKNTFSHRKKALDKMIQYLNSLHAC